MSESYSFRSSINGFNRTDVLAYIESILNEKAGLAAKISSLEESIAEIRADNEKLLKELDEKKQLADSGDKCTDCDISKKYEARLGAAMLDAKRFSEILVKEANDKASELFKDAYASADVTSVKVQNLSHDIVDINNQFNQSFKLLLDNMNSLAKSLESFKKDTKVSGNKFNFSTDFSTDNNTKYPEIRLNDNVGVNVAGHRDVNFDDADEFDIRVDVSDV